MVGPTVAALIVSLGETGWVVAGTAALLTGAAARAIARKAGSATGG